MRNPNHPKKGSVIRVEPIRSQREITRVDALLANQPRNRAIFVLGVNTNLRASDLIRLTVGDIEGLLPGEQLC